MIKAMIVEDKTAAIELLRWLIKEYCPDVTSVVSATSVDEALLLIQNFSPHILFLDIQLQHETGFDLLARVKRWDFEVIFTTAFNEYAIQAIRFSALDYLLKPINATDLQKAIERYKAKKEIAGGSEALYRNFIQNITREADSPTRLALPGINGLQFVSLNDIIRLEAEGDYTRLYFTNGKNFLAFSTLSDYEKMLRDSGYVRVHRSHLINPAHLSACEKEGFVTMKDGTEVEVSRRKKDVIESYLRK